MPVTVDAGSATMYLDLLISSHHCPSLLSLLLLWCFWCSCYISSAFVPFVCWLCVICLFAEFQKSIESIFVKFGWRCIAQVGKWSLHWCPQGLGLSSGLLGLWDFMQRRRWIKLY